MNLRNYFCIVLFSWIWGIYLTQSVTFSHDPDVDWVAELLPEEIKIFWIDDNRFNDVSKHRTNIPTEVISNDSAIKAIWNCNLKVDRFFQIQLHRDRDLIKLRFIENSVSTLRVSSGERNIRSSRQRSLRMNRPAGGRKR